MGEIVFRDGQSFMRRNPWAVWVLSFVTFGIYSLVWYYKINDETRRFLNDETISPGIALLAVTLGALIVVPPFVSIYRTGERIRRMQEKAGLVPTISPLVGLLLAFLFSLHHVYLQEEINRVWGPRTPAIRAPAA